MSSLGIRLLSLIETKIQGGKRFKQLEELTGIGARRWNAFSLGSQQPTIEMIEAVSKTWPQHAFWLATGIEDSWAGHTNPEMNESNHAHMEITAAELFQWKLCRKYAPDQLFGLMKKAVDAKNWKEWKSFADLFDEQGYISKLNITMTVLAWLTKEEDARPEYELELMRKLIMDDAPLSARAEEAFFDWKNGEASPKLKLLEPYLTEVL